MTAPRRGWLVLASVAGSWAAGGGASIGAGAAGAAASASGTSMGTAPVTMSPKRAKKSAAYLLAVDCTGREPTWASLPPTSAVTA